MCISFLLVIVLMNRKQIKIKSTDYFILRKVPMLISTYVVYGPSQKKSLHAKTLIITNIWQHSNKTKIKYKCYSML